MNVPLKVEERIRWSDMDSAGIMYFGNYIRLFEIAETELIRAAGFTYTDDTFTEWQAYPLRVAFHTDFHAPAYLDDLVSISIWISAFGNASMTMSFDVRRAATGELLGEGYCTVVTVDIQTRKAVRIPEALRRGLQPFFTMK